MGLIRTGVSSQWGSLQRGFSEPSKCLQVSSSSWLGCAVWTAFSSSRIRWYKWLHQHGRRWTLHVHRCQVGSYWQVDGWEWCFCKNCWNWWWFGWEWCFWINDAFAKTVYIDDDFRCLMRMMILQKLLKLMMILEWCFWINCSNWYMILDRWWEWCFCKDSETQLRRQVMSTVLETQVRFGRFIYFRNWINNFLSTCRRPFYPRTSWRMWRRTCKYSVQFDQKDRLRLRRVSKELVEKRKAGMAEFEVFKRLHNTMMSWVLRYFRAINGLVKITLVWWDLKTFSLTRAKDAQNFGF